MQVSEKSSRVSHTLRQELIDPVKAALPKGEDFNHLYGYVLAKLETAPAPSLQLAQQWLQNPEILLEERRKLQMARVQARKTQMLQVINANVPKGAEHEKLVADTLTMLTRMGEDLTPQEVKQLTLLRQEAGNQDLQLIPISRVLTADQLADNLERFPLVANHLVAMPTDVVSGLDSPDLA